MLDGQGLGPFWAGFGSLDTDSFAFAMRLVPRILSDLHQLGAVAQLVLEVRHQPALRFLPEYP